MLAGPYIFGSLAYIFSKIGMPKALMIKEESQQ
jgi:hypothetical protein